MSVINKLNLFYPTTFKGRVRGKKIEVCAAPDTIKVVRERNALFATLVHLAYDPPLDPSGVSAALKPLIEQIAHSKWENIVAQFEEG